MSTSTAINGKLMPHKFREFDITSMSTTINRLAPGNCYMPINSASTPPFSQRSFAPVPHAEQEAAMEEEERAIMKAKVEVSIVSEQVETFNAKLVEKEVVLKQAEVEVIATRGEEEVMSRLC